MFPGERLSANLGRDDPRDLNIARAVAWKGQRCSATILKSMRMALATFTVPRDGRFHLVPMSGEGKQPALSHADLHGTLRFDHGVGVAGCRGSGRRTPGGGRSGRRECAWRRLHPCTTTGQGHANDATTRRTYRGGIQDREIRDARRREKGSGQRGGSRTFRSGIRLSR